MLVLEPSETELALPLDELLLDGLPDVLSSLAMG